MPWTITLPSGTKHTQANVTAGQFNAVAEVLNGASWDQIEPTVGPRQLIAWVAILKAGEDDDKEITTHLVEVMQTPMVKVIAMLDVTDEE